MLTQLQVTAAKFNPDGKGNKLSDAGGLFLMLTPTGKLWRLAYRFNGKQKTLALGRFPDVSLKDARDRRAEAKALLAAGTDPSEAKKEGKREAKLAALSTFEAAAREWMTHRGETVEAAQNAKTLARFEADVFPWLGKRPIAEIEAPEILAVIKRVDERGARFTAHRLRSEISRVFRRGVVLGLCKSDPARDLVGAIPPAQTEHFASIVDPKQVGEMLRAFDGFTGTLPVQCALKLAPMLFVRPGELRKAEWTQFDLEKAEWRYLVSKTKTDHLVPLSSQAVEILKTLKALTGGGKYVFPGARDKNRPMSDAAVNAALRRLGYDTRTEITGHGFRAMARTILHEQLDFPPEVIEHQLAHTVSDNLGTAYNRTKFIIKRVEMMTAWSNYLDELKAKTA